MEAATTGEGFFVRNDGDAPKALASSAKTLEAIYEFSFQAHAPLETMNCTADVRKDSCEVWVPTQAPEVALTDTAKLLGLPESAVNIHVTLLGGGFGARSADAEGNGGLRNGEQESERVGACSCAHWTVLSMPPHPG